MTISFGDILWDISIGLSSIILMNVAFYVRVKGIKAYFMYFFICAAYVFMDYMVFLTNEHQNWFFTYVMSFLLEFSTIYLCACLVEGNVWRSFTYLCTMHILVGVLIGFASFFSDDIKFILYNDGLYRKEKGFISGYIAVSILQIVFAYVVSKLFSLLLRRISKKDYIFYKFFCFFYVLYAVIVANFKTNITTFNIKVSLALYVFMQCIAMLLFVYFLFILYNRSIRKSVERELVSINTHNEFIIKKYNEAVEENSKLDAIKVSFNDYMEDIVKESGKNSILKNYAKSMLEDNKSLSGNPLTGSILIDGMFSDLEKKLQEKGIVCELTVGKSCESHIEINVKKIAFIIKTLNDMSDSLTSDSYVVIGIRNKARKLFVSVNMQCDTDIKRNRHLIRLANYIRLEKGYCLVKNVDKNVIIDVLI